MIEVLVVEDDPTLARLHVGVVSAEPGFRVCGIAASSRAAIAAVTRHAPDLVLLDVHLPDGSGLDLLPRMRALRPQLDAIVVTAAREQHTVAKALRGGVTSYLVKPFPRGELSARLGFYRDHVHEASPGKLADQASVDQLFGAPPSVRASTRGFAAATLQAVREALAKGGELSAQEAAELVGVSRVSARRYVEHLCDRNEAVVRLRYGAGRPERRYAPSERA